MIDPAKVVSIHPYFKVKPGNMPQARALLDQMVSRTTTEKDNLYYDFTINNDTIFCREAYVGAEALLLHSANVDPVLKDFVPLVDILRVEIHGTAGELDKLRDHYAPLNPDYYVFACGVKRE